MIHASLFKQEKEDASTSIVENEKEEEKRDKEEVVEEEEEEDVSTSIADDNLQSHPCAPSYHLRKEALSSTHYHSI